MLLPDWPSSGVQVLQWGSYKATATVADSGLAWYHAANMHVFKLTIFISGICPLFGYVAILVMLIRCIIFILLGVRLSCVVYVYTQVEAYQ
jgi:hypothetical protein